MEQKMVDIGGRKLAVTLDGQGDHTIVFLHGLTGQHNNFYHLNELLKNEFKTVSVDFAGRGNSDAADKSSVFQHATDIVKLLDVLTIHEPILIGHSMGAFITSIIASELSSIKGAVYLDGACAIEPSLNDSLKLSLSRLTKVYSNQQDYVAEMKQLYTILGISWSDSIEKSILYEIVENDGIWKSKMNAQNILEDLEGFTSYDVKAISKLVECPVLLVTASGNIGPMPPLFPESLFDETKKYTKNIEVYCTNSNHYTMVLNDQPEMNGSVLDFLRKL